MTMADGDTGDPSETAGVAVAQKILAAQTSVHKALSCQALIVSLLTTKGRIDGSLTLLIRSNRVE